MPLKQIRNALSACRSSSGAAAAHASPMAGHADATRDACFHTPPGSHLLHVDCVNSTLRCGCVQARTTARYGAGCARVSPSLWRRSVRNGWSHSLKLTWRRLMHGAILRGWVQICRFAVAWLLVSCVDLDAVMSVALGTVPLKCKGFWCGACCGRSLVATSTGCCSLRAQCGCPASYRGQM